MDLSPRKKQAAWLLRALRVRLAKRPFIAPAGGERKISGILAALRGPWPVARGSQD